MQKIWTYNVIDWSLIEDDPEAEATNFAVTAHSTMTGLLKELTEDLNEQWKNAYSAEDDPVDLWTVEEIEKLDWKDVGGERFERRSVKIEDIESEVFVYSMELDPSD